MILKPPKATEENSAHLTNKGRFLAAHGELIALGLLIVTVTLINVAWILQDTRPQPFTDPYPHKTLLFVDMLGKQGETGLWKSIAGLSIRGRSPLFQLLAVPFMLLCGRSMDAALTVNILFEALLLACTYGIGKLALNGKAGLLAAFLVATYPPIVNLSKLFRPEFALAACVALSVWLLLLLLKTRSVKIAWLFGASLGFGMLIRHFFVLHLAVPTVVFGLYMLLFQTNPRFPPSFKDTPRWLLAKLRDPFVLRGLLPAALIATGLAATWYLSETAGRLWTLAQKIEEGDQTAIRGFGDVASHSLWWYALTAPGAISYVFTALLAIGLILGMVRRHLASFVLVVTFVASYVLHGLQAGLAWKRFCSALPIAAVLTAVWIVGIRRKRLATALSVGCIAVAAFNFSVVTWGVEPWSRSIAVALGAPLNAGTSSAGHSDMVSTDTSLALDTCSLRINTAFCPNPPRNENWRIGDILQTIQNDPECHEHRCDLTIVSKNENFNATVFDFCLIRDFAQRMIDVPNLTNWRYADYTVKWVLSDYVVYIPQWSSDKYAEAVTRFLESPPDLFDDSHQEVASYPLPGGQTARLIKRTKPLTVQEAKAVIAALNLPKRVSKAYLRQQLVAKALYLAVQMLDSDTLNSREKATQAVSIGNQLLNMGEKTRARAIKLLKQVARDADDARVWVALGKAYSLQQSQGEAISAYEKALTLDPQNYWAHHLLARLYAQREEWDAVIHLEQAALQVATKDKHRVTSAIHLLEAYESLGDRENACAQAVRVGNQLLNMGEKSRARVIKLLNQVACDADDARVWVALGKAYSLQQSRGEAISAYEKALTLDPQNYWAHRLLARLYAQREEWDAVVHLEQAALQVATDDTHRVTTAIRLVEAYESLGDRENACAVLQEIEQWAEEGDSRVEKLRERLACPP